MKPQPLRSFMMLPFVLLVCGACGGGPDGPGRLPTPDSAGVQLQGRVVNGEGGEPVAGATVTVLSVSSGTVYRPVNPAPPDAIADDNGVFTVTVDFPLHWTDARLRVARDGHETTEVRRSRTQLTSLAVVELYRTLTIKEGETIDASVFLGSYDCGSQSFYCRRVIVKTASAQTIEVEVLPANSQESVGLAVGAPTAFSSQRRVTMSDGEAWITRSFESGGYGRLTLSARSALPAPPALPGTPPPGTVAVRVEGRVFDAESGESIRRATVTSAQVCYPSRCARIEHPTSVSADDTGRFSLTTFIPGSWRELLLGVSAGGYEATEIYITPDLANSAELRVLRALAIRAGESIEMRLFTGSYVCGFESHLCRRIRVESAPGTLVDLELVPSEMEQKAGLFVDHPFSVTSYTRQLTVPSGDVWVYPASATRNLVLGIFEQKLTLVARRR